MYLTIDLLLRVGAALFAGMIVGLERESHGRAAGLRTTVLVCLAACLAMAVSESLYSAVAGQPGVTSRPDPARLAQGVLSGIGFLGAGSILRTGNRVQGVTTAATMWFVTVLGIAFGAGFFVIGGLGLLVAAIVLFLLPRLERLVKEDWYATVTLKLSLTGPSDGDIKQVIEAQGLKVKSAVASYDVQNGERTLNYELKFKKSGMFELSEKVVGVLVGLPGVHLVQWQ